MGLIQSFLGKDADYSTEYKRFKKGMERNPGDYGLKAEFIKFCLLNRFTKHEVVNDHISEALKLFEAIANADAFDLQCHYLVGKYYLEEKDQRKAYQVFLNAVKRFNQYVGKNPNLKSENSDLAYSVALNLMTLQSNPVDPQVELCFKIIRKSFPLHLKRIEMENEMAKPAPDKARLKQLAEEIRSLRAEEEGLAAPPTAKTAASPAANFERGLIPGSAAPAAVSPASSPAKNAASTPEKAVTSSTSTSKSADSGAPKKADMAAPAEKAAKPSEAKSNETPGIFSKLFNDLSPAAVGLTKTANRDPQRTQPASEKQEDNDSLSLSPISDSPGSGSAFLAFHGDRWEGPYTLTQLRSMEFLKPATWVCRAGSQQVLQAYEVPDLQALFQS